MSRTKTKHPATTKPDRLKQAHDRLTHAVESIVSGDDWQRMHQKPPSVDSLRSLYLGRQSRPAAER